MSLSSSTTSLKTTRLTRTEREDFTLSKQSGNMILTQTSDKKAFMQEPW